MKQTLNYYAFEKAFHDCDRFDQFGYAALRALFDYLEELEEDCGTEIELDVIALCCDWTAHGSAVEACALYAESDVATELDAEDAEEQCLEWLREQTQVIEFDASPSGKGGILVGAF